MSGHSKWNNIKRKKEKTDAQKGKIFTKIGREMAVAVREALEAKGYTFVEADIQKVPSTYTKIDDPELAEKMQKLLDLLEDNDDVQEVYHNWESDEE